MSVPTEDKRNWFDRYIEGLKGLAEEYPDDYTTTDELPVVGGLLPAGIPTSLAPKRLLDPIGALGSSYSLADAYVGRPIQGVGLAAVGGLSRALEQIPQVRVGPVSGPDPAIEPFSGKPMIPFEGNPFDPGNYADYAHRNLQQSFVGQLLEGVVHPTSLIGGPATKIGLGIKGLAEAQGLAKTAQVGARIAAADMAYDAGVAKVGGMIGQQAIRGLRQGERIPGWGPIQHHLLDDAPSRIRGLFAQARSGAYRAIDDILSEPGTGGGIIDLFRPGSKVVNNLPKGVSAWRAIEKGYVENNTTILGMIPERQVHALQVLARAVDADNVIQTRSAIERMQLSREFEHLRGSMTPMERKAALFELGAKNGENYERQAASQYQIQTAVRKALEKIESMPVDPADMLDPATAQLVRDQTKTAIEQTTAAAHHASRIGQEVRGGIKIDPQTGIPTVTKPIWDNANWHTNIEGAIAEDAPYRVARQAGKDAIQRAREAAAAAGVTLGEASAHHREGQKVFGELSEVVGDWQANPLARITGVAPHAITTLAEDLQDSTNRIGRAAIETFTARRSVRAAAEKQITAYLLSKGVSQADIDAQLPDLLKSARTVLTHDAFVEPSTGLGGVLGAIGLKKQTDLGRTLSKVASRYDQFGDLFDPSQTADIMSGRVAEMYKREVQKIRPAKRGIMIPGVGMTALDELHKVPGLDRVGLGLDQAWKQEAIGKLNEYFLEQGLTLTQAGQEAYRLASNPREMMQHPVARALVMDDLRTAGGIALGTWKEQNLIAGSYHFNNLMSIIGLGAFAKDFGAQSVSPAFLLKTMTEKMKQLAKEGKIDNSIPEAVSEMYVKQRGGIVPQNWLGAGESNNVPFAESGSASGRIPTALRVALWGGVPAVGANMAGERLGLSDEDRAKLVGTAGVLGALWGWNVPRLVKANYIAAGAMEYPARIAAGATAFEAERGLLDLENGQIVGHGSLKRYADDVSTIANINDVQPIGQEMIGPTPLPRPPRPSAIPADPPLPAAPAAPAAAAPTAPPPTGDVYAQLYARHQAGDVTEPHLQVARMIEDKGVPLTPDTFKKLVNDVQVLLDQGGRLGSGRQNAMDTLVQAWVTAGGPPEGSVVDVLRAAGGMGMGTPAGGAAPSPGRIEPDQIIPAVSLTQEGLPADSGILTQPDAWQKLDDARVALGEARRAHRQAVERGDSTAALAPLKARLDAAQDAQEAAALEATDASRRRPRPAAPAPAAAPAPQPAAVPTPVVPQSTASAASEFVPGATVTLRDGRSVTLPDPGRIGAESVSYYLMLAERFDLVPEIERLHSLQKTSAEIVSTLKKAGVSIPAGQFLDPQIHSLRDVVISVRNALKMPGIGLDEAPEFSVWKGEYWDRMRQQRAAAAPTAAVAPVPEAAPAAAAEAADEADWHRGDTFEPEEGSLSAMSPEDERDWRAMMADLESGEAGPGVSSYFGGNAPEAAPAAAAEAVPEARPLRRQGDEGQEAVRGLLARQQPGQAGIERVGSNYGTRTDRNAADSDLTLALAADHTTGGERRTQRAAAAAKRPMLMMSHEPKPSDARRLVAKLNEIADRGQNDLVLNVAGNGIYTLTRHGVSQVEINRRVHALLEAAINDPTARFRISGIISGGQTGVDMAGLAAAEKLRIPALARVSGDGDRILVRLADNRDRQVTPDEFRRIMAGSVDPAGGPAPMPKPPSAPVTYYPDPLVTNRRNGGQGIDIGRPLGGGLGDWGNPYKVNAINPKTGQKITQGEAVQLYADYIVGQPEKLARVGELRGQQLKCWCAPLPCHGHVLARLANELDTSLPPDQLMAEAKRILASPDPRFGATTVEQIDEVLPATVADPTATDSRTLDDSLAAIDTDPNFDAKFDAWFTDASDWHKFMAGENVGRIPDQGMLDDRAALPTEAASSSRLDEVRAEQQRVRAAITEARQQPDTPARFKLLGDLEDEQAALVEEGRALEQTGRGQKSSTTPDTARANWSSAQARTRSWETSLKRLMSKPEAERDAEAIANANAQLAAMRAEEQVAYDALRNTDVPRGLAEDPAAPYADQGMLDDLSPEDRLREIDDEFNTLAQTVLNDGSTPERTARLDALIGERIKLEQEMAQETMAAGGPAPVEEPPAAIQPDEYAADMAEPAPETLPPVQEPDATAPILPTTAPAYADRLDRLFDLAVERGQLKASEINSPVASPRMGQLEDEARQLREDMLADGHQVPGWWDNPQFEAAVAEAVEGGLNPAGRNYQQVKQTVVDHIVKTVPEYVDDAASPFQHPRVITDALVSRVKSPSPKEYRSLLIAEGDRLGLDLRPHLAPTFDVRLEALRDLTDAIDQPMRWQADATPSGRPSMSDMMEMDQENFVTWADQLDPVDVQRVSGLRQSLRGLTDKVMDDVQQAVIKAQQAAGLPVPPGGAGTPPLPPAPGSWTWDAPDPNFTMGPLRTEQEIITARKLARQDMKNAPGSMEEQDYISFGKGGQKIQIGKYFNEEAFKTDLASQRGHLSNKQIYDLALEHGASPTQAARLRARWDQDGWEAEQKGYENVKDIHVDYEDINNLTHYLKMGPMPFLTWSAKAIPKYLSILAHHPGLLLAMSEYSQASDQEIEEAGLPASFRNFAEQGGLVNAMATAMMGREGAAYANPMGAITPYSGLGKEQSDYMTPTDRVFDVAQSLGFGPSPLITLPTYMTGLTGDMPVNMLRNSPLMAGAIQALTGHAADPEELPKAAARSVRQAVAPGDTQKTVTGDPIKDYYVRKRIAAIAAEAGHQPTGEYLRAIQDGAGPIWDKALYDVEREMAGRTAMSWAAPVRWRLVDTGEQKIRDAQVEQGITAPALEELNRQPLTRQDMQYAAASLARNPLDAGETLEKRAKDLRVSRQFGAARAAAPITGGLSGLGADPRSEARRAQLLEQEKRNAKPISAKARASRDRAELTRGEAVLRQMGR